MNIKKICVLFLISSVLFVNCGKKKSEGTVLSFDLPDNSQQVREDIGIWLNEGVICKEVKQRKPGEHINEITTTGYVKVFFFTRMGCEKPKENPVFYHRYAILREGLPESKPIWEDVHKIELNIKSTNYRTWSYKTVSPGIWRMDVVASDGESVIKAFVLNVKGPEKKKKEITYDKEYDISQISLDDSSLCEGIENNTPVNPSEVYLLEDGQTTKKVWIWLKLVCEKFPAAIYLRWNRWINSIDGDGGWIPEYISSLAVKGKKWRTRGVKSCAEGKYRLDIIAPDGETIINTYEFEVKKEDVVEAEEESGEDASAGEDVETGEPTES